MDGKDENGDYVEAKNSNTILRLREQQFNIGEYQFLLLELSHFITTKHKLVLALGWALVNVLLRD